MEQANAEQMLSCCSMQRHVLHAGVAFAIEMTLAVGLADIACYVTQDELPPAFGSASSNHIEFKEDLWLERANNFRELVEPFDIANYYRLELDRRSGHYLIDNNRVDMYVRLEKMWRQHLRKRTSRPATSISSVVWAKAMEGVRDAPEIAVFPGTLVEPLPVAVLPPGTLPLGHKDL
jgi:Enhanced disease susceptibility 1 protein EP domain